MTSCVTNDFVSQTRSNIELYFFLFWEFLRCRGNILREATRYTQYELPIFKHYFLWPSNFDWKIWTTVNLKNLTQVKQYSTWYINTESSNYEIFYLHLLKCGIVVVKICGFKRPPSSGLSTLSFSQFSSNGASSVEYVFLATSTSAPRIEPC